MTKEQARQKLEDALNPSAIGIQCDLAEVVKFIFDNLDARQSLDNVPWKGMNQQ